MNKEIANIVLDIKVLDPVGCVGEAVVGAVENTQFIEDFGEVKGSAVHGHG